MQGTDPFLPPAASGGDSENAAPAGQERRVARSCRRPPGPWTLQRGSPGLRSPGRALPPPGGAGLSIPPAAQSQETPGGRCPSFLQPHIHAKGAPPGGGPSPASPGSFSGDPSLRPDPSLPPDFTESKVPPFPPHTMGAQLQRRGVQARVGAGFSSGSPWLAAQKGPCTDWPVQKQSLRVEVDRGQSPGFLGV